VGGPAVKFATPRIPAGALFIDGDRILPGHKAYGNGWDIPGSYVDGSESPATACDLELKEELGVQRQPQPPLIVDWAPPVDEGDKLLHRLYPEHGRLALPRES
jgi:8-oxo-dGTP diphosphatase